ncbi:uncharacterized protein [Atheta coriaria]|uniref:uncharacterized protein n=1 Tax=Dalotia coriaria TaxID=877792 RepID=UPI0031F42782
MRETLPPYEMDAGVHSHTPTDRLLQLQPCDSTNCDTCTAQHKTLLKPRRNINSPSANSGSGGASSSTSIMWWLSVILTWLLIVTSMFTSVGAFGNEFDKTEQLLDRINLEQSIAAVLQKVAYGSTTKRSIPDNAYPVTTLATPFLTTFRYTDGADEYLRVDVKTPENREIPRSNFDYEENYDNGGYGSDLEKDHVLPTSAPAADILKNNNNQNYDNPNRYKNDRSKPHYESYPGGSAEGVTEVPMVKTTTMNALRNVRPTKSIYSKDVPSYVPPSRTFFTPPLPPEYLNPFADKPTLRGTNSDGFANRRPIPPPSLMPNKDRIPFRPDLPPSKVINMERERTPERSMPSLEHTIKNHTNDDKDKDKEKKKSLNTPSQNAKVDHLGEFYGLNRHNESTFEYEKAYIPSITRILSGSNGRRDDIPDILLRTVTATPSTSKSENKKTRNPSSVEQSTKIQQQHRHIEQIPEAAAAVPPPAGTPPKRDEGDEPRRDIPLQPAIGSGVSSGSGGNRREEKERSESVIVQKPKKDLMENVDLTTQSSEFNLPNVIAPNVTKASSDEIWFIAWNVHVYLVVLCYILLAIYSIYKLVRYENDPHMFTKSYFLTIHLMLTVICVLRIFYLTYDPYNVERSFNVFLYDFLHNFPLSLLATTFAILILFLLKHTLTHLKVKTRPVFLVLFGLLHIMLCFTSSLLETLGYFDKASLVFCKTIFVLLAWSLGVSYLYLYKIIKNVLAKKSQNLSEECTARTSYASHITIAVALLFILLGVVQLYALFFIKVDRFDAEIKHHWILWSFELSVRFIEICIITLLVVVVSLRLSQREKQTGGLQLFPCTTSETSSDNMYPNNCNSNPNAMNYSRQEMVLDTLNRHQERDRDRDRDDVNHLNMGLGMNITQNGHVGHNGHGYPDGSFDMKKPSSAAGTGSGSNNSGGTLERDRDRDFERFERPKWGSERMGFDRVSTSSRSTSNGHKNYDTAKYYKPKYAQHQQENPYSEPVDQNQYERTRHEFERNDFDRRSRNSSNTSGRRSTTGRSRKNHPRPHLGVQTLPSHDRHTPPILGQTGGAQGQPNPNLTETMIVDEQGFVRFRHMQDLEYNDRAKRHKHAILNDVNHYSDA